MKRFGSSVLAAVVALTATGVAFADVAPDPCEGKSAGDACETFSNEAGTCQEQSNSNFLSCETATATSAGGSEDDGESEDDGDCTVSAAGHAGDASGATLLLAAGLVVSALRRRRRS